MNTQDIIKTIAESVRYHFNMNTLMNDYAKYTEAPTEVAQVAFCILHGFIGTEVVDSWTADEVRSFFHQCGFPDDFVNDFVLEHDPLAVY